MEIFQNLPRKSGSHHFQRGHKRFTDYNGSPNFYDSLHQALAIPPLPHCTTILDVVVQTRVGYNGYNHFKTL